ncbi:MAG: hypothetical protein WCD43_09815, partial [Candidatus Acidiferrales bacterium]
IKQGSKFEDVIVDLYVAQNGLGGLLNQSVFPLRTSRAAGNSLLEVIKNLVADTQRTNPIEYYEAYQLNNGATEFEHILAAELGLMDIYLVSKKRGYDTSDLILNGTVLFPSDLTTKVPEATPDVMEGVKCIAFELATAAGFHLHRANEAVLHRYYDAVTDGAGRPLGRNIGDYLKALKDKRVGDPKVLSALKDLKDLHRNPLIHPEDSLESIDEAIALLGSIHSVVVHMLKAIPDPVPVVIAPIAATG